MSTVADLVIACCQRGIVMTVEGASLRVEGPDEALTEDLLSEIKARKPALLAALRLKDEAEDLREYFEERAGILEYDAGLPRDTAELEAARITATYARNRGYLWASLRAALANYPVLLSQAPEKTGQVDGLPLGLAKVAVLPGRRVVCQGAFTGSHKVKA